jgi:hypothetical protein
MRHLSIALGAIITFSSLAGCTGGGRNGIIIEKIESAAALKARLTRHHHANDAPRRRALRRRTHPRARSTAITKMSPNCLPADKASPLVFYSCRWHVPGQPHGCGQGRRIRLSKVAIYEGGIKGWKAAGFGGKEVALSGFDTSISA